jgi:hypothetical protein
MDEDHERKRRAPPLGGALRGVLSIPSAGLAA